MRHRSKITTSWDNKGNSSFHAVSEGEKIKNGLENLQKLSAESLPESRAKHAEKLLFLSSLMAPYRIKLSFIAKVLKLMRKRPKTLLAYCNRYHWLNAVEDLLIIRLLNFLKKS